MPDKGLLSLVGATSDPDLITVKGLRTIADADLIYMMHWSTSNSWTQISLLKNNVGKRKGQHAYSQSEINKLIAPMFKKANTLFV